MAKIMARMGEFHLATVRTKGREYEVTTNSFKSEKKKRFKTIAEAFSFILSKINPEYRGAVSFFMRDAGEIREIETPASVHLVNTTPEIANVKEFRVNQLFEVIGSEAYVEKVDDLGIHVCSPYNTHTSLIPFWVFEEFYEFIAQNHAVEMRQLSTLVD